MRRFLTGTSAGDAAALLRALRTPEIQVNAVKIKSSNVPVAMGSRNVATVLKNCGKETPVLEVCWKIDVPCWKETLHKTLR